MKKRIWSLMLVLCVVMTCISVTANAETSGTCGENLTWTLDDSGMLTISGTGEMTSFISSGSPWSGNTLINKVVIENGVTSIGNMAFENCTALTDITIPESVTDVGLWTVVGCSALTNIDVDGNNNSYTSVDGVLYNKDITTVLAYPPGKRGAYNMPDSVTEIGMDAFAACTYLTNINVSEENTAYASVNGVLYDKAMTTLVICPSGKGGSYVVPDGVEVIENGAFAKCYSLAKVIMPDSVTQIGSNAFYGCLALESIVIPKNIRRIEVGAFYECSFLKDVYYKGSEDEWSLIDIKASRNDPLINAQIHYDYELQPLDKTLVTPNGDGTYTFVVDLSNAGIYWDAEVIAVLYREGRIVGIKQKYVLPRREMVETVTVEAEEADSARVFVWDDVSYPEPFCPVFDINW